MKYLSILSLSLVLVFTLGLGIAQAHDGAGESMETNVHHEASMEGKAPLGIFGRAKAFLGVRASTTAAMHLNESGEKMDHGSTTRPMPGAMMMRALPGIVSEVGANQFSITTRLKDATTTVTVNVTSSTKFNLGSTSASLANVSVGSRVEIIGKIATSTQSITAERVLIGTGEHKMEVRKTVIEKLKNLFKAKHDGSTDMHGDLHVEGSASVENSGTFMDRLANKLFGWI